MGDLTGLRVLVVEDEWLLASELTDLLLARGCEVIGPAPTVERALHLIGTERLDAAVVDANLRGEPATPVAHALRESAVDFVLLTAYAPADLRDSPLAEVPRVSKPWQADVVCQTLKEVTGRGRDR